MRALLIGGCMSSGGELADRVVLRNRWTWGAGLVGSSAMTGMSVFAAVDFGVNGVNEAFADRLVGGCVVAIMGWVVYRAAVWSALLVSAQGIVIRNPVMTWLVPWQAFVDCEVEPDGGLSLVTCDGSRSVFAFSGSVVAALTGARSAHRARETILAFPRPHPGSVVGSRRPVRVERRVLPTVWPLLVAGGLVAVLAAVVHRKTEVIGPARRPTGPTTCHARAGRSWRSDPSSRALPATVRAFVTWEVA